MTPKELLVWFSRQHEPAIPLESVPDHEALGVLMDRGKAWAWQSPDGRNWAAPTESRRLRSERSATMAETDCYADVGRLDEMQSRSIDACDPGLVAALAELAGIRTARWERAGNRHIPRPVVIFLGRQPWPPQGTTIVRARAGARKAKPGGGCPVCKSRPLSAVEFCGWCERWGLDHLRQRATEGEGARKRVIKFEPRTRKGKAG